MTKRSVLFSGLALVLTSMSAQAQNTATTQVSLQIDPVLAIAADGDFVFDAAAQADFDAGFINSTSGPTLAHRGNVPYRVTLHAQDGSNFVHTPLSGGDAVTKPVSDLSVTGSFAGAGAEAQPGADSGSATTFFTRATRGGNLSSPLAARIALDYENDAPGTYATTLVFTIVAQ